VIPKAELHVHLEGTTPPDLVRRLGERNGVALPADMFHDDGTFHWRDFIHFLEVYDAASSVIRTPEDYRDVTYEYLASCAAEGAIYVEVMSSPDHAADAGMTYRDHLEGITAGIVDAKRDHGIEGRLIVTCVRHFGTERAMEVARQVVANPSEVTVGFGMGGDEANWPPAQFADAFNYVAAAGLPCTVHAGEWAGPDRIREAIETLPIQRLGHGVRALPAASPSKSARVATWRPAFTNRSKHTPSATSWTPASRSHSTRMIRHISQPASAKNTTAQSLLSGCPQTRFAKLPGPPSMHHSPMRPPRRV